MKRTILLLATILAINAFPRSWTKNPYGWRMAIIDENYEHDNTWAELDSACVKFDTTGGSWSILSYDTSGTLVLNVSSFGTIDQTMTNTTAGGETGLYSYISHADNALTGDLIGIRGNARVNVGSASGNAIGGKFQAGNMSAGYDMSAVRGVYSEVVNKIPSAASVTWSHARAYEANLDLDQGSAGHTNTVTNAQLFYGVYNLPTAGSYSTVTNGYGIFLRNEAVGGTGQMIDAALYVDDLNHSGGIKGWDYGIDFSGIGSNSGGFGTADFRGCNNETMSNVTDGYWDFGAANLTTTGNVGIGVTPETELHVNGDILIANNKALQWKNSGGSKVDVVLIDNNYDIYIKALSTRDIFFKESANSVILALVDAGTYGDIGINTSTPAKMLHVNGGDVCLGDSTTGDVDGIIYFADDANCLAETFKFDDGNDRFEASDALKADKFISTVGGLAASADDVDVSGVSVLNVDTNGGNVTIGGFTGGEDGQRLDIYNSDANNIILEDDEGTGNQDIKSHTAADVTITAEGGATLVYDGTDGFWRIVGIAQ